MAVFKLVHAQQRTKSVTDFAKEIEELAPNANSQNANTRRKEMWKTRSTYTEDQIEDIVSTVIVGKYSMRKPDKTKSDISPRKNPNFPPNYTPHEPHKYPARGKTCAACNSETILQGPQHANPQQSVPPLKRRRKSATPGLWLHLLRSDSKPHRRCRGRPHSPQHDNTLSLHINGSQL